MLLLIRTVPWPVGKTVFKLPKYKPLEEFQYTPVVDTSLLPSYISIALFIIDEDSWAVSLGIIDDGGTKETYPFGWYVAMAPETGAADVPELIIIFFT